MVEARPAPGTARRCELLTLSARSERALQQAAARLSRCLSEQDEPLSLGDVAYTAKAGRAHLPHRAALLAESSDEAACLLTQIAGGGHPERVLFSAVAVSASPPVAFYFPAMSAIAGVGRSAYASEPVFRKAIDRCRALLPPALAVGLDALVGGGPALPPQSSHAAAASFAVEFAVAELWRSWGVQPSAVLGHGVGEYVAACVAGIMSVEDALRLATSGGDRFDTVAGSVQWSRPNVPIVSSVLAQLVTGEEMSQAGYWRRSPVDARSDSRSLGALLEDGQRTIVIMGGLTDASPRGAHGESEVDDRQGTVWLPSLEHGADSDVILRSVGELYVRGVHVDWEAFERPFGRRRVALPTYPFQRERHWVTLARASVRPAVIPDVSAWMHEVAWESSPSRSGTASGPAGSTLAETRWTIFADGGGLGDRLAERLTAAGAACTLVTAGDTYARTDRGFQIAAGNRGHMAQLWADQPADQARRIVHLWSLDADSDGAASRADLAMPGCASLLHLAQLLGEHDEAGAAPRVVIATRGAQSAGRPHRVSTLQAPIWGLAKTLTIEYPARAWTRIDLDPEPSPDDCDALWNEIVSPDDDDQIAYRRRDRLVARLVAAPRHSTGQEIRLRADATYLITGAFGGLGLQMARWLVDRGARHLALLGRRGAPDGVQQDLLALAQRGAHVVPFKVDVAIEADLARTLAEMNAMPPLGGIVHAAGVLDDGLVQQQNWPRFSGVMTAKADGAWHLHRLTVDRPLDFFVLFSSGVSMLGAAGQANYAAANAYLDALAHDRRSQGLPAISINWGPWAGRGMAAALGARDQDRLTRQGWRQIPPSAGLEAFGRLLRDPAPQVGVLPVDWQTVFDQGPVGQRVPYLEHVRPRSAIAAPKPVPALDVAALRGADTTAQQSAVETFLAAHVSRALALQAVDVDDQLGQLGLDSLMALDVRNAIERDVGAAIPVVALMDGNSIRTLARMILAALPTGPVQNTPAGEDSVEDASLDEAGSRRLLERVPDMSDADVDALLARLLSESGTER